MKRPAVFFDRDNTLIACDGYLGDPAKVVLVDGAADAVVRVRDLGFAAVVFSNQSGVARGMFAEEAVHAVNHRLDDLLQEDDPRAKIDRHDYCPYHPAAKVARYRLDSELRKPRPGMIHQAAAALNLDLSASWVVGDAPRDIAAGHAAGLRTVLLKIANLPPSPATSEGSGVEPDFVATSLAEAVDLIERHRAGAAGPVEAAGDARIAVRPDEAEAVREADGEADGSASTATAVEDDEDADDADRLVGEAATAPRGVWGEPRRRIDITIGPAGMKAAGLESDVPTARAGAGPGTVSAADDEAAAPSGEAAGRQPLPASETSADAPAGAGGDPPTTPPTTMSATSPGPTADSGSVTEGAAVTAGAADDGSPGAAWDTSESPDRHEPARSRTPSAAGVEDAWAASGPAVATPDAPRDTTSSPAATLEVAPAPAADPAHPWPEEPVKPTSTSSPKSEPVRPAAVKPVQASGGGGAAAAGGKPVQGGFVVKPNQAPSRMTWGERMRVAKEGGGPGAGTAVVVPPPPVEAPPATDDSAGSRDVMGEASDRELLRGARREDALGGDDGGAAGFARAQAAVEEVTGLARRAVVAPAGEPDDVADAGSPAHEPDVVEAEPVATADPVATPRGGRVGPATPAAGDGSRSEELLEQILVELRRREEQGSLDFSVSKLLAGIVQVLALAALFFAYLNKENPNHLQSTLLLALTLQVLTISMLIMGRQK